jgi:hypothetical protein
MGDKTMSFGSFCFSQFIAFTKFGENNMRGFGITLGLISLFAVGCGGGESAPAVEEAAAPTPTAVEEVVEEVVEEAAAEEGGEEAAAEEGGEEAAAEEGGEEAAAHGEEAHEGHE